MKNALHIRIQQTFSGSFSGMKSCGRPATWLNLTCNFHQFFNFPNKYILSPRLSSDSIDFYLQPNLCEKYGENMKKYVEEISHYMLDVGLLKNFDFSPS